jgi:Primase C terminal 1 (PriCT-1)
MLRTYQFIYQDQLTEKAKNKQQQQHSGYSKHLGWVFVCDKFQERPKAFRTYNSLFAASQNAAYYTPNTFYRSDRREAATLRWLNAMIIDIDVKNGENEGLTIPDIEERIRVSGLPSPAFVVSTPSGGFHVYWLFDQPRRAFPKVTALYNRVQRCMAQSLGGDLHSVGAERWYRVPEPAVTVHLSDQRVSFDSLCDWFTLEIEGQNFQQKSVCVETTNLVEHPAIQKLLEGVSEGQRDNTCYTLALALKASGYAAFATEEILQDWNQKNTPPMPVSEIRRKVKSAYKPGAPAGPAAFWIRELSGEAFSYRIWEQAKDRSDRTYSHLDEWQKDFIAYIKLQGGEIWGSQRKIAAAIRSSEDESISMPYTTFQKIVERLINKGYLTKKVTGSGRKARTILILQKPSKVMLFRKRKRQLNGFNSNTFLDQVVGGYVLSLKKGFFLTGSLVFAKGEIVQFFSAGRYP